MSNEEVLLTLPFSVQRSAFQLSKMISHFPMNKPIPSANPLEQPSLGAVIVVKTIEAYKFVDTVENYLKVGTIL
jgi:hypothetical protein